jgi:catechol 2,3-dioxygenase-like lactoylglutathione lyase family enzyme
VRRPFGGRRLPRVGPRRGRTGQRASGRSAHYDANYYAAYVLDPDGNNIEAVCHHAPP